MFRTRYLRDEQLKGFEKYKYNSIDTSPLSKYVMHPFWNQTVKLIPLWVAPNLLTFTGFLFVILVAVIISYYDPDFSASADTLPQSSPIPQWVWLACAVFHFLAHTLDGIDGKQARKTGTSGPVGELFDHGLDSWTSLFTPFCIYSIFGRADYAFSPFRVQFIFWAVFLSFYFSHWEKYNTGILYLPWAYDITQLILLILYILTGLHGHSMWKFSLTIVPLTSGNIFELLTHIGAFAFSIPVSLYNVYLAYQANTLKQKSFGEALRPFVPLGVLICITVGWSIYSPNHVLDAQPRLFFLMTGTIFSNIACRLIVSQMSCTRCEAVNWLLVPLAASVGLIFLSQSIAALEITILKMLTLMTIFAHVHYGISVVRQLCQHLNIQCFSITRKRDVLLDSSNKASGDRVRLLPEPNHSQQT